MAGVLTESTTFVYDVLGLEPRAREEFYKTLTNTEFAGLLACAGRDLGTRYGLWADDPVGFWRMVLLGHPWSKQIELAKSIESEVRTVAPAGHAVGKTFGAAQLACWFGSVHPPDSVQIITTAPKFRQVKHLLWPHMHTTHAAAGLPGTMDQVQWKIGGRIIAYGFSAGDYDEDAVQGVHAEHLLIIVDEAGGISHTLGKALESITSGVHTRLLAIGNPPTDEEGSWFEERAQSPLWNTVRIGWEDTPNYVLRDGDGNVIKRSAEQVPEAIARNLVDERWVNDQMIEFGPDSTFVEARVHARFPHGSTNKTMPWGWIEAAMENETPDESTWVRLGVDVAADGGDEFVIARAIGNTVTLVHNSSGAQNANPADVAQKALLAIQEAERIASDLGEERKVRVKVDAIGLGWAVSGLLKNWGQEGMHSAVIVDVKVSEKARDEKKFTNKRAEMWWTGRTLIQPVSLGEGRYAPPIATLKIDKRCAAQLNAPTYGSDSQGRIKIEKKDDIKKRGLGSPDRAEAVLLALYEPTSSKPASTGGRQLLDSQL